MTSIREQLGCWLNERWKAETVLCKPAARVTGVDWLDLCNRHEVVKYDPITKGRICCWKHSSELTVSRVFPSLGPRLLRHCLLQWPLNLDFSNEHRTSENPEISVLIAIGGTDRISQFRTVLASLRGQSHPAFEIIVVEQSETPELADKLPSDIRYFFTQQEAGSDFNKGWALNVAARKARGSQLLIHDGDYVVPRDYVLECSRILRIVDAIRPARFNFHLDKTATFSFIDEGVLPDKSALDFIVQNNPTPMGIRRDVYWQVGGHDESFVGWGGEDVEFLSRVRTTTVAEGGWLPVIHLWHPPAAKKASGHRNQTQQDSKLNEDPQERIKKLQAVDPGGPNQSLYLDST